MSRPKIKVACVDVDPAFVKLILGYADSRYDFEITRDRDAPFVIHGCGGMDVLKYPGVRIFVTGENVTPNFAISDYAIGFERMEFGDRYKWMPLFKVHGKLKPFAAARPAARDVFAKKSGFCAYVMSNTTNSDDNRTRIFDLLSAYKPVNSGGRWRNNVGGRVADKIAFQETHKFVIAFENCSHPGYLTEKFADAAASNAVPIYWGDPNIGKFFNPKSFVNCHDFDSLEAVVERVKEIDQDDDLYLEMLAEPWFPGGIEPDEVADHAYEKFLSHIFDQDPEAAYRRNRGRWGLKSEKNLFDMYARPHVHAFKRLRKRWRSLCRRVIPRRPRY